ncbi:unnamed protein product [Caenorhabditis nigoni]
MQPYSSSIVVYHNSTEAQPHSAVHQTQSRNAQTHPGSEETKTPTVAAPCPIKKEEEEEEYLDMDGEWRRNN